MNNFWRNLRGAQPELFDAWCGVIASVLLIGLVTLAQFFLTSHAYAAQLVPDPNAPTLSGAWLNLWQSATGFSILLAGGLFALIRLRNEDQHAGFTFIVTTGTLGMIGVAIARDVLLSTTNETLSLVVATVIAGGAAIMAMIPFLQLSREPVLNRVVDRMLTGRRPNFADEQLLANYNTLIGRLGVVGGLTLIIVAAAPWVRWS